MSQNFIAENVELYGRMVIKTTTSFHATASNDGLFGMQCDPAQIKSVLLQKSLDLHHAGFIPQLTQLLVLDEAVHHSRVLWRIL